MSDAPRLLDDGQVQRFIRDGYLLVQADFATPVHDQIRQKLEEVFDQEGNIGNNILPRIPQIARVFAHPAVRGALESLLGPGYMLNPHRHCHLNPPGGKGQSWHKDCYVFDHNMRQPRSRWILALYYPQDVTPDMGPTGILPGRQFYEGISDPDPGRTTEEEVPMCGRAGTIALTDFNSWHRATANTSQQPRYMLKFQFARLHEPQQPSWAQRDATWTETVGAAEKGACLDVWHWLRGGGTAGGDGAQLGSLESPVEAQRLQAAYALGPEAAPAVLEALRREARAVEARIEAKTADNAHGTNPTALRAAQALMAMGPAALPQLIEGLADAHWLVRAAAADAVGSIGAAAGPALEGLVGGLTDAHWWVRRNAVEAIGRIGAGGGAQAGVLAALVQDEDRRVRRVAALALAQLAQEVPEAVEGLVAMLEDEDRYNRFYAGLALRKMPCSVAQEALLDHLFVARWCPLTSAASRY